MKSFLMLAAAAAVIAAVGVSPVRAAPIPGATHVTGTWSEPDWLYVFARVNGVTSNGLTSLGCPFVLRDYVEDAQGTLTAAYKGWIGPYDENTNTAQFLLRAHVTGTLQDVAGNSYAVTGNFTDSSTHVDPFGDFLFEGVGHVRLSGPAGRVDGIAAFRAVNGELEFSLIFSSIRSCTVTG
jgi:hypothetical protein